MLIFGFVSMAKILSVVYRCVKAEIKIEIFELYNMALAAYTFFPDVLFHLPFIQVFELSLNFGDC